MNRLLLPLYLLLTFSAIPPTVVAAPPADGDYDKRIKPFLAQHCVSCHGPDKTKGDFRVDTLTPDFGTPRTAMRWEEIMGRVNSGDMPPKGQPRPPADEMARLSEWVSGQLAEAEAAGQAARKVAFRRLTREEYANTVRDLLGVTVDVTDPTGLPEDPDWHGFQRIGAVLTLSPTHVEKYLALAESAPERGAADRASAEAGGRSLESVRPARRQLEEVREGVPSPWHRGSRSRGHRTQ